MAEWNTSERSKGGPVEHEVLEGWGLVALQGLWSHSKLTTSQLLTQDRSCHSGPSAGSDILQSACFDIWLECICSAQGHQRTRCTRWIHGRGWLGGQSPPCCLSPCRLLTPKLNFCPSCECHLCICAAPLASDTLCTQSSWCLTARSYPPLPLIERLSCHCANYSQCLI